MGSGFKDFAAGDILTANDVDGYLMRQTVMTFADASARDSALSGVLDEGMMAYLENVNKVTFYDGSAWKFNGVLQVVQASYNTGVANNTNTYADTGLSATITPHSTSSKILVLVYHGGLYKTADNAGSAVVLRLMRGATQLFYDQTNLYNNVAQVGTTNWSANYLDSPNTTSATTYKTQFANLFNGTGVQVQASLGSGFQYAYMQLVEIAG